MNNIDNLALAFCCFNAILSVALASYPILPAAYPNLPAQPPILPQAYRNYFSLDGDTAGLIRSIAGPNIVPETLFNCKVFLINYFKL